MNEVMDKMFHLTTDAITKLTETKEDFIFTTIANWMMNEDLVNTTKSKICVSKRLLIRAITCFQQEHREEYDRLVEESYNRTEENE